jgi:hypothetical protein
LVFVAIVVVVVAVIIVVVGTVVDGVRYRSSIAVATKAASEAERASRTCEHVGGEAAEGDAQTSGFVPVDAGACESGDGHGDADVFVSLLVGGG